MLPENIKTIRKSKGLLQEEVAVKLNVVLSEQALTYLKVCL